MKRALVTGATRGIGFAIAKLLRENGYEVVGLYSQEGDCSKAAKRALPSVKFLRVDVAEHSAVEALFADTPPFDLLVNNAGVALDRQVQDTTIEEYERVFSVNMQGTFSCVKYAVKGMIARGNGAIVNLSSVWGQTGGSCESVYSATKGAVEAFTKALAKELAPSNITVNCVAPGVIDTAMNGNLSQEDVAYLCERIPLGRMGLPEEVASAVLFLAEHRYITGCVLPVNGGFYI